MSVPTALRPRNESVAARALSALFLVAAGLLLSYVIVQPAPLGETGLTVAAALLVGLAAVGALLATVPPRILTRCCAWLLLPVTGELLIGAVALALPDRLDLAHPLYALTVLFAASQLRALAAAGVTALGVAIETALLAHAEPPAEALVDALFVAAVLIATATLLTSVMNRLDRSLAALRRQSRIDPLTGLANRRVIDDALTDALGAARAPGTALVLVDVDGFKKVNDRLGHPTGDDALVHIGHVLRRQVRSEDAVVGRLGGDELAVLLVGCDATIAARRADDLVAAVRATPLPLPDGTALPLSVSAGVAHAPVDDPDARALYAAADEALYRAKRGGRGRAAHAGS